MQSYTLVLAVVALLLLKLTVKLLTKEAIQQFLWAQYVAVSPSPHLQSYKAKTVEIQAVVKEKNTLSPQDHYARWTKLNRQFDKLTKEKTELEAVLASQQARFAKYVGYALMATTTAPLWFFKYQYRKQTFFYLERGIFPGWVDWFLALPFMATGSVGLTIWSAAASAVIDKVEGLVRFWRQVPVPMPTQAKAQ